jgi:hypothetical protein
LYDPFKVGVPVMELPLRTNPGGKADPAAAVQFHVYGAIPPEATSGNPLLPPYATLTVPAGGAPEVIESIAGPLTVIVYATLTLTAGDSESVTLITTLYDPAAVGVPEIAPVLVDKLRPGGSEEPAAAAQLQV